MERIQWGIFALAFSAMGAPATAQDQSAAFDQFQGNWDVTELVEDGKVIPAELIRSVLPSGGKVEIVDNAIVFRSVDDRKLRARTFSIDAARYPRTIDVNSGDKTDGWGIYRFDGGRLIICVTSTDETERPDEFSAPAGSGRMLLVLTKVGNPTAGQAAKPDSNASAAPPQKPAVLPSGDDALRQSLVGVWRYTDSIGALIVKMGADGTYSTTREVKELRLFQTVFVSTPVSNGTWTASAGELKFHVVGANDPARLNRVLPFTIRSVSATDFIFVDTLGRVGKATRMR
jgi:uncharacterized protein (TIGR03067 family)